MTSASHAVPLDSLPPRTSACIVDAPTAGLLPDVGVVAGSDLTVERVLPFGGPVVIRIGTARVAIARSLARTVLVRAVRP